MSAQEKDDGRSEDQAKAQLESIREMIAGLEPEECEVCSLWHPAGFDTDECKEGAEADGETSFDSEDECREYWQERIREDPLSVQIRSGWYSPGEESEAEEFEILLCTGGPAVRIRGELGEHNEPSHAYMEHQDWFKPWTEYYETGIRDVLLTYARQFYFGE